MRFRPVEAAARTLLRRAERTGGHGALTLAAFPAVAGLLEQREDWRSELARRTGRIVRIEADPALALWSGHVAAAQPG